MIDNYNDLSVGKYLEILAIDKEEGIEDIDKQVRVVSVLSGMTEDEVLHMNIGEYTILARKADFLRIPRAEELEPQVKPEYEVGGFVLRPVKDYKKLETGQYIDFKAYAADMESHFVELLSVILVPKGHRYGEGYEMEEVQEAIRSMSVADALGVIAFFLKSYRELMLDSLNYSEREAQKMKDPTQRAETLERIAKARADLLKNGDGSQT